MKVEQQVFVGFCHHRHMRDTISAHAKIKTNYRTRDSVDFDVGVYCQK